MRLEDLVLSFCQGRFHGLQLGLDVDTVGALMLDTTATRTARIMRILIFVAGDATERSMAPKPVPARAGCRNCLR